MIDQDLVTLMALFRVCHYDFLITFNHLGMQNIYLTSSIQLFFKSHQVFIKFWSYIQMYQFYKTTICSKNIESLQAKAILKEWKKKRWYLLHHQGILIRIQICIFFISNSESKISKCATSELPVNFRLIQSYSQVLLIIHNVTHVHTCSCRFILYVHTYRYTNT